MEPKYFTRAEAEALLPVVEPLLRDIRRWRGELLKLEERLAQQRAKAVSNGHAHPGSADEPRVQAQRLEQLITGAIAEVNGLGIEVKNLEMGLIDFPAEREGRVVYLCWRLGEPRISWWHELDAGFAGRAPLEDENL